MSPKDQFDLGGVRIMAVGSLILLAVAFVMISVVCTKIEELERRLDEKVSVVNRPQQCARGVAVQTPGGYQIAECAP